MLNNFLIGLPVMVICLLMQAYLLIIALHYYKKRHHRLSNPSFFSSMLIISMVMLILVVGNICQVFVWAVVFRLLGEFSQMGEAVYHSMVNFATLGYGDFVMSDQHKLLGPLEAINGVLMIGVSTAALMATFQDANTRLKEARGSGRGD